MSVYDIPIGEGQKLSVLRVRQDSHWRWLAAGWADFKASWRLSVLIGVVPVIAAWVMVVVLWQADALGFLPAVCGGFALVGPILAISAYDISRRREAGEEISFAALIKPKIESPGQVAIIGFVLMVVLMIWARLASLLYALATANQLPQAKQSFIDFALQTPEGLIMITVGTVIGACIAAVGFGLAVVSIPLTANKQVDALTAMFTSGVAVARNQGAMTSFAFNIALLTGICLATGFVGLIVVFPWLGHATWHCYRSVIGDADSASS